MTDDERMDKFHVIPNSNSIVILSKQYKVPVCAVLSKLPRVSNIYSINYVCNHCSSPRPSDPTMTDAVFANPLKRAVDGLSIVMLKLHCPPPYRHGPNWYFGFGD